jgi:alpha,alpha-trehalase
MRLISRCTAVAIVFVTVFPGRAQTPSADPQARIRAYISEGWDSLSRSMSECKSVVDPKIQTTPVLYLPAGLPIPPAVSAMQNSCHVDVRHLARAIHQIGDIRPSELPVEGLLYLPNRYVVPGGRFKEM